MRKTASRWLSSLAVLSVLSVHSPAGAGLLDVGPTVPQVIDSTEPNLGHGFPLWYRDTNRLPLELCLVRGMCLTAEPNPNAPFSFPDNLGAEVFWFVADASMPVPGGNALLVQAIEGAFPTEDATPGGQLSFARIRIRVDTAQAGTYTVTTPYKVFTFDVTDVAGGINHTEDIGIAEGNIFTGALAGSIGPFLYCTNAPIEVPGVGSFIGDPNVPCAVQGSTFPDPKNQSVMMNKFRVEGPGGLNVETDQFTVSGKIYTDPIPTPLTVDRLTYSREATGVQLSSFATTQALSNQRVPTAPFPGNFALNNAPSALQVSADGLPDFAMLTNSPADGKFFGSSGIIPEPVTLPATATVTNVADLPVTTREVSLVDEVVIDAAMYNPLNKRLTVSASSYDRIAAPALSAFIPGSEMPLGAFVNSQLNVTFPVTDNTVNPAKTYNIPPEKILVRSALGGSDTRAVASLAPGTVNQPPVALGDTADVAAGSTVTFDVVANDSDPDLGDLVVAASVEVLTQGTLGTATAQGDGTILYAADGITGTDTFTYTVRDGFGAVSNTATVTVKVLDGGANLPPVAVDDAVTASEDTPATFSVTGNDSDPDGNLAPATVVVSQPADGAATVGPTGSVTYTPPANFSGTTSFTYTVKDSLGAGSNSATVTVTVNPVNDAPVARNDAATTSEDTPVTFSVVANDSDQEGNLLVTSVQIAANPANGTAAPNPDGTVTYAPAANFSGTDTFSYTVSDGTATSTPATVTVTVNPVNDAPVANGDVATAASGSALAINVVANDTDIDGTINPGTIVITGQPTNGTVTANPNGTVTYTSNAGFSGPDSFSYRVSDNNGLQSGIATVAVTVAAPSSESVTILRAQYRASTGEWRVDGAVTSGTSNSVTVYVGRNLTGTVLGSAPVTAGAWSLRVQGSAANPVPDASNTVSAQGTPGGGSRLAFPLALR